MAGETVRDVVIRVAIEANQQRGFGGLEGLKFDNPATGLYRTANEPTARAKAMDYQVMLQGVTSDEVKKIAESTKALVDAEDKLNTVRQAAKPEDIFNRMDALGKELDGLTKQTDEYNRTIAQGNALQSQADKLFMASAAGAVQLTRGVATLTAASLSDKQSAKELLQTLATIQGAYSTIRGGIQTFEKAREGVGKLADSYGMFAKAASMAGDAAGAAKYASLAAGVGEVSAAMGAATAVAGALAIPLALAAAGAAYMANEDRKAAEAKREFIKTMHEQAIASSQMYAAMRAHERSMDTPFIASGARGDSLRDSAGSRAGMELTNYAEDQLARLDGSGGEYLLRAKGRTADATRKYEEALRVAEFNRTKLHGATDQEIRAEAQRRAGGNAVDADRIAWQMRLQRKNTRSGDVVQDDEIAVATRSQELAAARKAEAEEELRIAERRAKLEQMSLAGQQQYYQEQQKINQEASRGVQIIQDRIAKEDGSLRQQTAGLGRMSRRDASRLNAAMGRFESGGAGALTSRDWEVLYSSGYDAAREFATDHYASLGDATGRRIDAAFGGGSRTARGRLGDAKRDMEDILKKYGAASPDELLVRLADNAAEFEDKANETRAKLLDAGMKNASVIENLSLAMGDYTATLTRQQQALEELIRQLQAGKKD